MKTSLNDMKRFFLIAVGFIFFFFQTIPSKAFEIHPELGVFYFMAFGDSFIGNNNPGVMFEGHVRLMEHFGTGFNLGYAENKSQNEKWVQMLLHVDAHILNPESPGDLFAGIGFGDSIMGGGNHGILVQGRVGGNFWFTKHVGLSANGGVMRVFRLNALTTSHAFTAGFLDAGFRIRF